MNKSDSIYIAGHTGLIGSACIRYLESNGFTNIILADHADLELTNQLEVLSFFKKNSPKYVILAAGRVGGILENQNYPADFLNSNLSIQVNVFKAAHAVDVRKIIFFASSCMYPRYCSQPMPETILLSGNPEPTSLAYAISKIAGLQLCLAYNQQYKEQRFIPVIPCSVYGPNDNFDPNSGHVLSSLIHKFHEARSNKANKVVLWGSGNPRREFIYSDDIAAASIKLLTDDTSLLHLPVNIGTGSDYSISELAEKIAHLVEYAGEICWDTSKPDGAPRKLLDSSRIREFGWSPMMILDDGIRKTYEWYLANLFE